MAEKGLNEIPKEVRDLFEKGNAAFQHNNLDYAIHYYTQVLEREPGFFECRQNLRATQFKRVAGGTSFFKKMLGGAKTSPLLAKAQLNVSRHPLEAIKTAEQVLKADPRNAMAHRLLAEAALAAELPRTACLSLEILLKNSPDDVDLRLLLGRALADSGQIARAEQVHTDLVNEYPLKAEYAMLLKNLSARKTMEEQGYDALAGGTGSYRDILKDKEGAVMIEQEGRQVKSEETAAKLIVDCEQRLAQEPGNLKLLRTLAELHIQKKEFDRALEYYARIKATDAGGADPSLDQAIAETHLRKFDERIQQLDPASPGYSEAVGALRAERDAYELSECQQRAERYPGDLHIRYDLAELYRAAGKLNEAIQEYQRAQANPHKRIQALRGMGQCFLERGLHDLAARQFREAIKEKLILDDEKKELLYLLGTALEKMAKPDEAIEQFKQIYEADIGFRDVAAKIDAFYRR